MKSNEMKWPSPNQKGVSESIYVVVIKAGQVMRQTLNLRVTSMDFKFHREEKTEAAAVSKDIMILWRWDINFLNAKFEHCYIKNCISLKYFITEPNLLWKAKSFSLLKLRFNSNFWSQSFCSFWYKNLED